MEKALIFTQKQKSLIWNRFVAPANGNAEDAHHFVEYCETFGLNPLVNDVIFQKFEGKRGTKTKFLTTRDGLLRIASRHHDFVGPPNSNVVREGDEFEFLPSAGDVKHKFGTERGKIIGAYAVLDHKRYRPLAVWVDFEEYFNANSGKESGKFNTWDKMPSAMIQKVAESWALRRQFPLGGLMTEEEMGVDHYSSSTADAGSQINSSSHIPDTQKNQEQTTSADTEMTKKESVDSGKEDQDADIPEAKPAGQKDLYLLDDLHTGVTPAGIPFAKIKVTSQTNGKQLLVLAREKEKVELAESLPKGAAFSLETETESGFVFLKDVIHSEAV